MSFFATATIGSGLNNSLQTLLASNDDIVIGSPPSYQTCKTIYTHHPLGAKLVEKPIKLAQSQKREIKVDRSPGTRITDAFVNEWHRIGADKHIFNLIALKRVYGIASIAVMVKGQKESEPLDFAKLYSQDISFNVFDPLNTAGSLVLNQDPNAIDFQHVTDIRVGGKVFHRSRSCTVLNGSPIYIEYTSSAFGFVGRSVYQRSLFPLKSFLQTMQTDDMVSVKAGVLVAKMLQPGSVIDDVMGVLFGGKRTAVKEARNYNIISISPDEDIDSLNLQNLEAPAEAARRHILMNIAAADDMPAKLMTEETLAEGFGEGTEDAKAIARYIDGFREDMQQAYDFFDKIVRHRAWNPDFYETIKADFPDYKKKDFQQAFYEWSNSFSATWPNLLKEPDSELAKVEDVQLRAAVAAYEVLRPDMDPDNKATLAMWLQEQLNSRKLLFPGPALNIDFDLMREYEPPVPDAATGEPKPFGRNDAIDNLRRAVAALDDARGRPPALRSVVTR